MAGPGFIMCVTFCLQMCFLPSVDSCDRAFVGGPFTYLFDYDPRFSLNIMRYPWCEFMLPVNAIHMYWSIIKHTIKYMVNKLKGRRDYIIPENLV